MPMTLVVTRNTEQRVRGFLASCLLEVAPGVYTSPNMTPAVRLRVWAVLKKWGVGSHDDFALMTWPDAASAGGQAFETLGSRRVELREASGIVLARSPLSEAELCSLTTEIDGAPF